MLHKGDITKIKGNEVEIVDVVTFGAPCQDLSVAGKRKGMLHESKGDDETSRSGLFYEAIRIIKEMRDADRNRCDRRADEPIRPRYAIYENVPGAFSSNSGDDWRCVLEEVVRVVEEGVTIPRPEKGKWSNSGVILGDHYSVAWRVFDAQYWGVPQRRRRICLVADFNGHSAAEIVFNEDKQHRPADRRNRNASLRDIGDESRSEVQPISQSLSGDFESSKQEGQEVTEDAGRSLESGYRAFTYQDREGKPGGGKGGLIQEDRATSLRTNNYMTVFQPVAYGIDPGASRDVGDLFIEEASKTLSNGTCPGHHNGVVIAEPMVLESNQNHATITQTGVCPTLSASMGLGGGYVPMVTQPTDLVMYQREFGGKVTENPETSPTLEAAMGMGGNNQPILSYAVDMGGGKSACDILEDKRPTLCTTHYGEPAVVFENHAQDGRFNGPLNVSQPISHTFGAGGNNVPIVLQPYRKTSHPKTEDEPQGWEEAKVNDTLNVFDNSEMRTPTVVVQKNYIDAEMEIQVRKYPVDIDGLKEVLKAHKTMSNKEIADKLNKPLTLVEHWFRTDGYFTIPDADDWFPLKKLLGIETDKFDESITTFETQTGNYDMRNRIYVGETAPTLRCSSGNDFYLLPVVSMDRKTFNVGQNFAKNLGIHEDGIQPTLVARGPGGGMLSSHRLTYQDTVGTLCARDYKGVGSQYVEEDKLVVIKETD